MIYVIDTSAWIEYLLGSNQGLRIKKIFENRNNKYVTLECNIAEIKEYCLKKKVDFQKVYRIVRKQSYVFPILIEHWMSAAEIKTEMRKKHENFGLIDSLILAKQEEISAHVITKDNHFKGLKNVLYLEA